MALKISFAIDGIGVGSAPSASSCSWRRSCSRGATSSSASCPLASSCSRWPRCSASVHGDLFNLFVFFQAPERGGFYALVAVTTSRKRGRCRAPSTFAVTNSIGAFFILTGIALLYGRTGALNMAQIGEALAGAGRADGLVNVSFTLMAVGFFVKAAIVPFHFMLTPAYSVRSDSRVPAAVGGDVGARPRALALRLLDGVPRARSAARRRSSRS